ncbi:MAG: hypothetical protein H6581_05305 [Bacteroidia bacterium]|nr:hypothetical protein [Bacteroidia bacterium]
MTRIRWKSGLLLTLITGCFLLAEPLFGQTGLPSVRILNFVSPEVQYSLSKANWEFRYRPLQILYPAQSIQFHLMAGKVFARGSLKIFNYNILDSQGQFWTGIRLDQSSWALKRKVLFHWQIRYFYPLTKTNLPYAQLIELVTWKIHPQFSNGIFGITNLNFTPQRKNSWFLGPCSIWKLDENLSAMVSFNYSVPLGSQNKWSTHTWFFFWRFIWKFSMQAKEIPEK